MSYEIDHVLVCCDVDAPEAAALIACGLTEGSGNTHPGQGTANRRFFFRNAYLELLWVHDPGEARREPATQTRLWERWSGRTAGVSPFCVIFRAASDTPARAPFPTRVYAPAYLPPGMGLEIATSTPLSEPELLFVSGSRCPVEIGREPLKHRLPIRELTHVHVELPGAGALSAAAAASQTTGLITFASSTRHRLALQFDDGAHGRVADLRPTLPLTLTW